MIDHYTNQEIQQTNRNKSDVIAWSTYGVFWLIALILPNYSIFRFIGEEHIRMFHYRGFENLFDQIALLLIALSATLLSLGRPMIWKRILLFVVPVGLGILYLGTFIFRSAATGFSQNFHYGYYITVFATLLSFMYAIYRQFRSPIVFGDGRQGTLYIFALVLAIISMVLNVINNPWFDMLPNILVTLLPFPFWLAGQKKIRRRFVHPEIIIILAIGVLVALYQYRETEISIHRSTESFHKQMQHLK